VIESIRRRFLSFAKRFSRTGLYEWVESGARGLSPETRLIINIGSGGEVSQVITRSVPGRVVQTDVDAARNPDIVADVCDMHMFDTGTVDAVFLIEVLEHVRTPQRAIDEIRRILKPGGRLFMSTPFMLPIHDAPHDYFRYTRYGLAYLCRDFAAVELRPRNDYMSSITVLALRSLQASGQRRKLASLLIASLGILLYPVNRLLGTLYKSEEATTGYVLSAVR